MVIPRWTSRKEKYLQKNKRLNFGLLYAKKGKAALDLAPPAFTCLDQIKNHDISSQSYADINNFEGIHYIQIKNKPTM